MATDTYTTQVDTEKRGGGGCLKGCLIALVVIVLLAILASWWISKNWRGMTSKLAEQTINQILDNADLPPAEKEELKAEAKRITDGIADGTVSLEQAGKIMEGIGQSPLMPLIMVKSAEAQYLNGSGLTDEEKAEGRNTLARYARGLADETIDQQSAEKLLDHVADKDANGEWKFREEISDDDLRAFLAEAKQQADDAGIPEEVEPIDPSEELKKVIDAVLGPAPPALPPAE